MLSLLTIVAVCGIVLLQLRLARSWHTQPALEAHTPTATQLAQAGSFSPATFTGFANDPFGGFLLSR